jgi:DoxX-like family
MRRFERTNGLRAILWVVQGLLAALYLLAGGMKLLTPVDALAAQAHMPGTFMKFIGACEVAGALGLILPGVLRIGRVLTPLAAVGLLIIMIGAVLSTAARMGVAPAVLPLVVGLLDAIVVYGRWPKGPQRAAEPHPAT